jgi:hypothetical protein
MPPNSGSEPQLKLSADDVTRLKSLRLGLSSDQPNSTCRTCDIWTVSQDASVQSNEDDLGVPDTCHRPEFVNRPLCLGRFSVHELTLPILMDGG